MNDLRHSLVTEGNLYGSNVRDDGGRMAVQEGERHRENSCLPMDKSPVPCSEVCVLLILNM